MPDPPKITPDQAEVIEELCKWMAGLCQTAVSRLTSIPKERRPDWLEPEIVYWKNAKSVCKWMQECSHQLEIGTRQDAITDIWQGQEFSQGRRPKTDRTVHPWRRDKFNSTEGS